MLANKDSANITYISVKTEMKLQVLENAQSDSVWVEMLHCSKVPLRCTMVHAYLESLAC